MVKGRVSIIIPSRNERFLDPTVRDLLAKSRGDIELVVVLDGYWAAPPLPNDKRIKIIHFGDSQGMRPGINAATKVATGQYFLKCDGHTMWDEGYDEKLKACYAEDNWVVVPRRYALDAEKWCWNTDNPKYPIDYHYLSYPFEKPDDPDCGMHGTEWRKRRDERKDILFDDEMSSQGSGWFMSRQHWEKRIGPLDIANYGNFIQEFQEVGLKTWLGGGAVKVNKATWYSHLFKGRRYGRGYTMGGTNHVKGAAYCVDYWMNDRWDKRVHDLRWLIEKFSPVPTWPADLDEAFRVAHGMAKKSA
jgi:glycosyltransferase involved in cell wall biosynthesis